MSEFCYYQTLLSGEEGKAYYEIREGLLSLEPEIRVPRLSYTRLSEIYAMVKLDSPQIFYASAPLFRTRSDSEHLILLPEYLFERKQIPGMIKALESRLKKMLLPAENLDPHRALRFVQEWIFHNVRYEKLRRNYSHEIYGVLSHGIGVCEGIAKSVKRMLDFLEIESIVVIGRENEEKLRHAWNIVYLYGKPCHVDVTYDLSLVTNGRTTRYFCLNDEQIFRDHASPVYPVPQCK